MKLLYQALAATFVLFYWSGTCQAQNNAPVVFWASDSLSPGDCALLYGAGFTGVKSIKVWPVDNNDSISQDFPPSTALDQPAYQSGANSVKFHHRSPLGRATHDRERDRFMGLGASHDHL